MHDEYRATMEVDESTRLMNERLEIEPSYKYSAYTTHDNGIESQTIELTKTSCSTMPMGSLVRADDNDSKAMR